MGSTHSDRYANFINDPVMEAYFSQLPSQLRAEIRARKPRPETQEELQHTANAVKRLFDPTK